MFTTSNASLGWCYPLEIEHFTYAFLACFIPCVAILPPSCGPAANAGKAVKAVPAVAGTHSLPSAKESAIRGQLGHYLAGYVESDGTLITPKEGSKNTPTINIAFNIKDRNLVYHLTKVLGYGSVQVVEASNFVLFVVRSKQGILDLIYLMNGKFRTPKLSKLNALINYINSNASFAPLLQDKIPLLPLDSSNLGSNAWLAGFSARR